MHRATLDQGSSIIKTGPYHFLAPRKTVVKEVQWLTHQLQLNRSDVVLVSIYLAASGLSCSTRDFCCIRQGLLSRRMGSGVCWLRSCRAQAQVPCGMWDFHFEAKDLTCVPCIPRQILNHRTTREVPDLVLNLALPITSFVSLGKLLNLSESLSCSPQRLG